MNAAGADRQTVSSEDSKLAVRCQAGDLAAYNELMCRHREAAYRVAYAVMGNHDQAEDVVQEAFLRAYRALHRFDPSRPFAAWIKRITVNWAVNALRKQQRRSSLPAEPVYGANSAGEPAQQAAAHDLRVAARKALAVLPPKQRVAITLFALDDMDLASTAEAMGCAVGTVKTHLYRARQKLRQVLADYLEEEQIP